MAALDTSLIKLPVSVAEEIVTKAKDTSTIQSLSAASPMLFKDIEHIVFTKSPEAEFVAEGAQKSPAELEFKAVQGKRSKAQVTVRMSNEFEWADEDNQLKIIDEIIKQSSEALGRALDYGIYHAINPRTGTKVSGLTALTAGANEVTATDDPSADLDKMIDAVNEDYDVNGLALSKVFANRLRKVRVKNTGMRLYPEIPINLKTATIEGITAATSNTVSGRLAKTATGVEAILGDFGMIKWGIVRDLGLEKITMGDPDGLGDLKRLNQIAYRVEIVYSWAVLDPKAFAVLKAASSSVGA